MGRRDEARLVGAEVADPAVVGRRVRLGQGRVEDLGLPQQPDGRVEDGDVDVLGVEHLDALLAGASIRTARCAGTSARGPSAWRSGRDRPSPRAPTASRGGTSPSAGRRSPAPPARSRRARSAAPGPGTWDRCTSPRGRAARGCGRRRRRPRRTPGRGSRGSAAERPPRRSSRSPCAIGDRADGRTTVRRPSHRTTGRRRCGDGPHPVPRSRRAARRTPPTFLAKLPPPINIFRMLAGGEGLLRAFSRFGNHLLYKTALDPGAAGDRHRARGRPVARRPTRCTSTTGSAPASA